MNLAEAGSSRDPYQLDRLAKEVSERPVVEDDEVNEPLPTYVPLAHNNPFLVADSFNVEEFLLSRSHTSLPDLRSELREYLATLREELVKLINDDYEAFISLSTDLRGEGTRLNKLKTPLGDLKSSILQSRHELQIIQDTIEEKLAKRATLREEKGLLHLLLKISESMTRLESLLHIAAPPDERDGSSESDPISIPSHLSIQDDQSDEKNRGSQAKHLSRVASEYTQLLYHVAKAKNEKCAFVDDIQWRVDRIHSTLSADLDHLFATILVSLTDDKTVNKVTDIEKAKWTADLTECLRTYDILHLWRDAEDVIRREVMRAFVKKTVYPGALAAPHSPLMPHTPFPTSMRSSFVSPASSNLPPRTPYTPFTAIHSKSNPFQSSLGSSSNNPYSHVLDDSEDSLSNLYTQILRFVERDLSKIMLLAEKVAIKATPGSRLLGQSPVSPLVTVNDLKGGSISKAPGEGFEIMANVVWSELGNAIMDELGTVVFAAGRPDDFRKNHEKSQAFLRSLEFLAPSLHAVELMRSHPTYISFERKWQLPVYFQMRWKEIVSKLESSLAVVRLEAQRPSAPNDFVTAQANAAWVAITACWSAEIFIPELSSRFWRLTLQLLSRYKTWLDNSLEVGTSLHPARTVVATDGKTPASPASTTRASTPIQSSESASADSIAAEDGLLRRCSLAIIDIQMMKQHVLTMWQEEISIMLPDLDDLDSSEAPNPEVALNTSLSHLTQMVPTLSNNIIHILTRRCCEVLLPVKSIPTQFRAMSNRRMPNEPSHFVANILKPIKAFFGIGTGEGPGARFKEELLLPFASEIFESVSERYANYVSSMRKTEESLKRLKRGQRTFSLFGNGNARDEGKDEERITSQMILDVVAFGKDAESLGIDLERSKAYKSLDVMVHSTESEVID